jgi:hypothetical protein
VTTKIRHEFVVDVAQTIVVTPDLMRAPSHKPSILSISTDPERHIIEAAIRHTEENLAHRRSQGTEAD